MRRLPGFVCLSGDGFAADGVVPGAVFLAGGAVVEEVGAGAAAPFLGLEGEAAAGCGLGGEGNEQAVGEVGTVGGDEAFLEQVLVGGGEGI